MPDIDLDRPDSYAALDTSDMLSRVTELPEQMEDAWRIAGSVALPAGYRQVESVVVVGMGGSAIGGSLLESYASDLLPVPFQVCRGYVLPAYVGSSTLVIAISYSGNTEETLSGLQAAHAAGAKLLVITTGGQAKELAEKWDVPTLTFTYSAQPRATIGYLFTPLVRLFAQLGFLPEQDASYREALSTVQDANRLYGAGQPAGGNEAKQLAHALHGRIAVVYGAEYLSAVARRWKTQLNENAKNWAFFEEFSELNHNAIVGYRYPAPREISVVVLSGAHLGDRVRIRMDVTQELMDRYGVRWHRAEARGGSKLAQMFSLIALGDYVSYYLALLNGADPTEIEPIDFLKSALARHP